MSLGSNKDNKVDLNKIIPSEKNLFKDSPKLLGKGFAQKIIPQQDLTALIPVVTLTPVGPMTTLQAIKVPAPKPVQNPLSAPGTSIASAMLKPQVNPVNPVNPIKRLS